jgi:hypothetical protein
VVLFALIVLWMCPLAACNDVPRRGPGEFDDPIEVPPTPSGVDVIEHLARYRVGDEEWVRAYAEKLEGYVERPWTVERLAAAYAWTLNTERRAALAYLLAASRHVNGLRAAGNAFHDRDPAVGMAAARGIELYWLEENVTYGGAEHLWRAVSRWWNERRTDLEASEQGSR